MLTALPMTPRKVFDFAGKLMPGLAVVSGALCVLGLGMGLSVPGEQLSGGALSRIALVHVPSTWLSLLLLVTLAFWAAVGLVQNRRLPHMMAQALAPTGGMFAFLAIWTGALWSKGAGGSWWVGDARQVAELVMLMVYLAIVGAPAVFSEGPRADRAAAVLAVVGVSNVPVFFFSVLWWEATRGSSPGFDGRIGGSGLLLAGVVCVTVGFWLYATLAALVRLRHIILERECVLRARSEA